MKKQTLIIVLSICFLGITQFGSNREKTALSFSEILENFEYDGCSMFPDGNYGDCCRDHDDTYFFGGNWQERLRADNELFSCVLKKDSWYHIPLAPAMWTGVRIGGAPIFPTSYRWGFGRDMY